MNPYVIESGTQFSCRLRKSATLDKLHPILFTDEGPHPRELIQLSGQPSTGKTTLVTELIARCILPLRCGGKNSGTVIINTDHHFHIFKLVEIMESFLIPTVQSLKERMNIIKSSLKNLLVMSCFDNMQLLMTLKNVDRILYENTNYNLVIIDGISAYYWSDRADTGVMSYDAHCLHIVKEFRKLLLDRNVVGCFTRSQGEPSLNSNINIDHSMFLKKNADNFTLYNYNRVKDVTTCKSYVLNKTGLCFVE